MAGRCDQCDARSDELMCNECCVVCKTRAVELNELQEWRGGKRRVFWRVRWTHAELGPTFIDYVDRAGAMVRLGGTLKDAKVYRVTVKPKKKVKA